MGESLEDAGRGETRTERAREMNSVSSGDERFVAGRRLWVVLVSFLMPLKIHVLTAGLADTNAYVLTDAERGEALLVDAPEAIWPEVKEILAQEKCVLRELWLTHGHWDHMQGAAEVVAESGAKVSAHADDKILLETPGVMEVFLPLSIRLTAVAADRWVEHGQKLEALGREWEVRHAPGHCPGSVVYWCASEGIAFSGDTILANATGRTDFPRCSDELLARSIREQIYTLPDETVLFPGHYEPTKVGVERRTNKVVRG